MEAPGIEGRWREVGFDGSQYVSSAKRLKNRCFVKGEKDVGSVSIGLYASDCSNCRKRISRAIEDLEAGNVEPAHSLLAELLLALESSQ